MTVLERPDIAVSCVVEDGAPGGHPTVPEAFSRVEAWADVTYLDAGTEHPHLDWGQFDLYRKEKRKEAAIEDLKRAASQGVTTMNPLHGTLTVIDRPTRYHQLKDHVPIPRAEYGKISETGIGPPAILKKRTQLIDKGGLTQEVVFDSGHLDRDDERLVQEYVDFDTEYKGYQFGDEFRAVELNGPTSDDREEVRSGQHYDTVRDIASVVQDVTGLNLFGVDVILTGDEAYLVDVNDEGSYTGVDGAGELYENAIYQRAKEAVPDFEAPAPAATATKTVYTD